MTHAPDMENAITREQAEPCIVDLLQRITDDWSAFNVEDLPDVEARTLYWLVGAGLVERRLKVRIGRAGDNGRIEATLVVTGEYGWIEAMDPVCNEYIARFGHAATICENVSEEEWRLTADGCQAKESIDNGEATIVVDYVLKDGIPPMMQRALVRGKGRMLRLEYRDGAAGGSDDVRVTNWSEGAAMLAEAIKSAPPEESDSAAADGVSLDAKAVAVFLENPDWTKKRIAEHLGCNSKSLTRSRCPKLTAAIAAQRSGDQIQHQINALGRMFVAAVAKGRRMSTTRVADLADGRVFIGQEGVAAGLADRVSFFEDELTAAKRRVQLPFDDLRGEQALDKYLSLAAKEFKGFEADLDIPTLAQQRALDRKYPGLAEAANKAGFKRYPNVWDK